jgi:hypothetical protein
MTDSDRWEEAPEDEEYAGETAKEELEAKMERLEQLYEEDREQISFEWCESIREAGKVYRETESLEAVGEALDTDEATSHEAVALYLLMFEAQPEDSGSQDLDASQKASNTAIKFFREHTDPEEFAAASDEHDSEEYRGRICEFVGSLYRYGNPEDMELTKPPVASTLKTPNELLADQISSFTESASRSFVRSQQQMASRALQSFQNGFRKRLADSISSMGLFSASFRPFLDTLQEHYDEIQAAIVDGVHNFEAPEDYNPEGVEINEQAQNVAVRTVEGFLRQIVEEELTDLFPYLDQLHYGLEHYKNEEYILPCYAFTFALEGIMEQLCREQKIELEAGKDYYNIDTKVSAFAMAYSNLSSGYYGVETGEVTPQLESFLHHRNALAHGDPNAVIDENIATVAMLFVMLALYPTLELLSDDEEENESSNQ